MQGGGSRERRSGALRSAPFFLPSFLPFLSLPLQVCFVFATVLPLSPPPAASASGLSVPCCFPCLSLQVIGEPASAAALSVLPALSAAEAGAGAGADTCTASPFVAPRLCVSLTTISYHHLDRCSDFKSDWLAPEASIDPLSTGTELEGRKAGRQGWTDRWRRAELPLLSFLLPSECSAALVPPRLAIPQLSSVAPTHSCMSAVMSLCAPLYRAWMDGHCSIGAVPCWRIVPPLLVPHSLTLTHSASWCVSPPLYRGLWHGCPLPARLCCLLVCCLHS